MEERKDANRNEMDTDDIELNGRSERDEDVADETDALDGEAGAEDGGEDEEGCCGTEAEAEDADGEDGQGEAPAGNEEEGGGKKFFKKKVKKAGRFETKSGRFGRQSKTPDGGI